ncbi:MAG: DUF2721 domain-containing protein [Bacteroidetes bacterium]|nr:DUF2721 domain-containing protein [Bacteroidota bacterium]
MRIFGETPIHILAHPMNELPIDPIQAIQSMLAPALGISAVGLLLLGLNNRYSIIINRLRLLNEERRKYIRFLQDHDHLEYADNIRFMSISNQSGELLMRSRLVRNAILSMQTAIALFVLTSVFIGANLFVAASAMKAAPLWIFVCAMVSVLAGILFAGREVHRSFRIVLLEAKADD